MQNSIDHIAIGAENLTTAADYFREQFGLDIPIGGKHAMMATHNRLMRLQQGCYFELIAIDPDATPPQRPRWFGLDEASIQQKLSIQPHALSWIVQTSNLDEVLAKSPVDLGEVLELSRDDLRWRLTVPKDGRPVMGGLIPAFIEWPEGMHPSHNLPDLGVRLEQITLSHPQPAELNVLLDRLDIAHCAAVRQGETGLSFSFATPSGQITIS